jgi:putative tryptophan/tyrosine transport system substrate-binding protein
MRRRDFIGGFSATVAWPLAARAQQPAMPVVGFLSAAWDGYGGYATAFRQGLGEQGYVEGRNVEILYRYAEFRNDRLPMLAADLVRRPVAAIFTTGGQASMLAAKSATATTPIVFVTGTDPVELGLVASLNRPGGNLTGIYFLDQAVNAKRLQLLHQVVPTVSTIGFLVNPTSPPSQVDPEISEAESAARLLGLRLAILKASNPGEIEAAFASLAGRQIGALLVLADAFFNTQRDQLAALAARNAVPAIYPYREPVDAGGLMSYGVNLSDAHRLAGTYVARILKGDKPANLPVQQSTRFELVINLKTARALGIIIPETMLATADEVIQ